VTEQPAFEAPWQARAFALTVALHERGLFSWEEWTTALSRAIDRNDAEHYEQWLDALEQLVLARGLCDAEELRGDHRWS
jgi:nitrile hydratase accessory protein